MVVLLVDALGWELAGRTPGLAPMLTERRRLDTILGFSSGALPTLFTGKLPAEHGRWLMYRRAVGRTPFAGFDWLRLAPGRVRRSWRVGRALSVKTAIRRSPFMTMYTFRTEMARMGFVQTYRCSSFMHATVARASPS